MEGLPVEAIDLYKKQVGKKKRQFSKCDENTCLGCGVCYGACEYGGVTMKAREQRVYTPEDTFERIVAMAIERGKLSSLIFDAPDRFSHRAMAGLIHALEVSPPYKAAMAIKPLKSAFLNTIVNKARAKAGQFGG